MENKARLTAALARLKVQRKARTLTDLLPPSIRKLEAVSQRACP